MSKGTNEYTDVIIMDVMKIPSGYFFEILF